VQATPSLQLFALFVWPQPVAPLHVSVVHTLLSSQAELTGVLTHAPAEHASVVQLIESVQLFVLSLGYVQPEAVHTLSVHGLLSLHRLLSRT
jgi:hypothetical protein